MSAKVLLEPLAIAYGLVASIRNWCFDRQILHAYRSPIPVISVGNVEVGGSGKTPLVMWLLGELRRLGRHPVVLSRGYGGREAGPRLITERDTARDVGDEPLLIARKMNVPVVVSRRRVRGARLIEDLAIGDVIVLDDGFQHRWLARDIDIVLLRNLSDDEARLLPRGRLREPLVPALRRAHLLIFSSRTPHMLKIDHRLEHLIPSKLPRVSMCSRIEEVRPMQSGMLLESGKIIACCAIANPEGFFESLRARGFTLVSTLALPDHSSRFEKELDRLLATRPAHPVVITEKDAVKLSTPRTVYVAEASLQFDSAARITESLQELTPYRSIA